MPHAGRRLLGDYRRNHTRQNLDIFLFVAIITISGSFILVSNIFSIKLGLATAAAIICLLTVINPDIVILIFIFLLCFAIKFKIGSFVVMINDFAFLLMFLAAVFMMGKKNKILIPARIYILPCALFLSAMTLSAIVSAHIGKALPQIMQYFYYIFLIPFTVLNIVRNSSQVKKLLYIHALFVIANALLIILQYYLAMRDNFVIKELFPFANRGEGSLRSFGSLGPSAGLHFAIACIVFVSSYFMARTLTARAFYIAAILVCIFASVCTGIRSMTLLVCIGSISYILYKRKPFEFALMALTFMVMLAIVLNVGPNVYPFKLFYHGVGTRIMDSGQAIATFYEHPFLGVGPAQLMRESVSEIVGVEGEFLNMLAEAGIFGGISFVLLCASILVVLFPALKSKNSERRETASIMLFIYLIYLFAAFTVTNVFFGGQAHMFMLLHGYALRLHEDEKSDQKSFVQAYSPEKHGDMIQNVFHKAGYLKQ